jgi:hypothetical protein
VLSGQSYILQPVWRCHTCNLDFEHRNRGVCASCALVCHSGHNIVYDLSYSGGFFCDCGAGLGRKPCQCLPE